MTRPARCRPRAPRWTSTRRSRTASASARSSGARGLAFRHCSRRLPRHREAARRAARRPRAVHRRRDRAPARGADAAGVKAELSGARSTSTASGARCSARASASPRSTTCARCACWSDRCGLLLHARHRARAVAQPARRVRRLHRQSQAERLPLAAHRRHRRGRRVLEVQIRTGDMHQEAELGICAPLGVQGGERASAGSGYDDKIAGSAGARLGRRTRRGRADLRAPAPRSRCRARLRADA